MSGYVCRPNQGRWQTELLLETELERATRSIARGMLSENVSLLDRLLEPSVTAGLQRSRSTHFVIPGYFETMKTRVLQGRTFTEADMRPDALYIVIDDMMAARLFPNESPVGK